MPSSQWWSPQVDALNTFTGSNFTKIRVFIPPDKPIGGIFFQDRAINDTTVDNGRLIHILNHFLDHRVSDPVFLVIVFEIRSRYVASAYMTCILPIKKYGSHSVLNMFTEYSMTDPDELARCGGFRYPWSFSLLYGIRIRMKSTVVILHKIQG